MLARLFYFVFKPLIFSVVETRDRLGVKGIYLSIVSAAFLVVASLLIVVSLPASNDEYSRRLLIYATIAVAVGGIIALFDATVGDEHGRVSSYEAFLGTLLDTTAEIAVFFGVIIHLFKHDSSLVLVIAVLALITTMLVRYIRSLSEYVIEYANSGLSTRFERLLVLTIFLTFNLALIGVLIVLFMNIVTIYQKIYSVHSSLSTSYVIKAKRHGE